MRVSRWCAPAALLLIAKGAEAQTVFSAPARPPSAPSPDESSNQDRSYRFALSAEAAFATSTFDRESAAVLLELSARWQVHPMLGFGARYTSFSAGPQFRADMIGPSVSFHPSPKTFVDPYVAFSFLYFATVDGRLQERGDLSRTAGEGTLGLNLAFPHPDEGTASKNYFALGWDLRYGGSDHEWFVLGMHLEGRL